MSDHIGWVKPKWVEIDRAQEDAMQWLEDDVMKAILATLENHKGPVDISRLPPEWRKEAVRRATEKTMERPEFKGRFS